jgi:hypothetical protein
VRKARDRRKRRPQVVTRKRYEFSEAAFWSQESPWYGWRKYG